MGRPNYFLSIFWLLFLTKFSTSRVIDYELERSKLCENAGIVGRNCTASENILIKSNLVACQELENEREKLEIEREKADGFKEELGRVRGEKGVVETYARRVVCPTKIRNVLERFAIRYIGSEGEILQKTQRLTVINNFVKKLVNPKPANVRNAFDRMACLSLRKGVDSVNFSQAWLMLKSIVPLSVIKAATDEECNPETKKMSVRDTVVHLASAHNENEARKRWDEMKSNWTYWCTNGTTANEFYSLMQLAASRSDVEISDYLLQNSGVFDHDNPREMEYARDLMKDRKVLQEAVKNKGKYKSCILVMYLSEHSDVEEIRMKLEEEWPQLTRGLRFHNYCFEFTQLYHLVSTADEHVPGVPPPTLSCYPNSTDFEWYIQQLVVRKTAGMAYVAKTLYSP